MVNAYWLCDPDFFTTSQRRRGEASFANCEVMSAKVTASEVRTSRTVGARVKSASASAGAIAAGSSIRTPRQPIARAIAA